MKYRLFFLVFVGIVSSTAVCAQSERAVHQELTADYNRIARSFQKKDTHAIMALAAPGFTMKMGGRVLNARQAEQELKREIVFIETIRRVVLTIQSFKLQGKRAIATVSVSFAGTTEDDRGRRHTLTMDGITRDTWIKTPHGWRIQHVDTVKSRSTLDGKPMQ